MSKKKAAPVVAEAPKETLGEVIAGIAGSDNQNIKRLHRILSSVHRDLNAGTLAKRDFDVLIKDTDRFKKAIDAAEHTVVLARVNQAIQGLIELAKMAKF